MYYGIQNIDDMDDEEVMELVCFIGIYEENKTKKLAYEIAKATWGKR
jgi:hypothetical protein